MAETFEALYLIVLASTVALLVGAERAGTYRQSFAQLRGRVAGNVGLFVLGNVVALLVLPAGVIAFATRLPPGLVSGSALPPLAQWLLSFVLLDLWRYAEHRLYHRASWLWRVHRVHHSDTRVDVTTAQRHHPIEVAAAMLSLMAAIALLGLPAPAVAAYLLASTVVALCAHANLRLPERADRRLRQWVVTPAVHRLHHSDHRPQTDSNYAAVLTVWDRIFGTYTDPEAAPLRRFGLDRFRHAGDARMMRLLRQPFLQAEQTGDAPPPKQADAALDGAGSVGPMLSMEWRRALVSGAVGTACVSAVMWAGWVDLARAWRGAEAYQWGWLVVPVVVYLLAWHERAAAAAAVPRSDWSGALPALAAALLWWVSDLMNLTLGRQLALVLALHGVSISMLGWQLYRRWFAVLALLFFMVPSGDLLQPPLRWVTARSIEVFAAAMQLPYRVDGFAVIVDGRRYIVADACSGLAFVTLAMFLGYSFALALYRSGWKAVALAVSGGLLAVVCNLVRVNTIIGIDWLRGTQMDLAAHGHAQWMALLALLASLLALLSQLRPNEISRHASDAPEEAARKPVFAAPAMVGVMIVVVLGVAGAIGVHEPAVATMSSGLRHAFPPDRLGGLQRVAEQADWRRSPDASVESLTLHYLGDGGSLRVRVVETLSAKAKLDGLREAAGLPAGWHELAWQTASICDAQQCTALRHSTFQRERSIERLDAYAAYVTRGRMTDSVLAARAAHALDLIAGRGGRQRSIALIFETGASSTGEVVAMMRDLSAALDTAPGASDPAD